MTDRKLKNMLNTLAKLANELNEEAKARYGPDGHLYFEADGTFYLMVGYCGEGGVLEQENVRFSSEIPCYMDCGAW